MKITDSNPYSSHYNRESEAIVSFKYKMYDVIVDTNGSGSLGFNSAEPKYEFKHESTGKKYKGKGSIQNAIEHIHTIMGNVQWI